MKSGGSNKVRQPLLPFVDNPHLITKVLVEGNGPKTVILTLRFIGIDSPTVTVIDTRVLGQFVVLLNPELVEFSMWYVPDTDFINAMMDAKIPWRRIG